MVNNTGIYEGCNFKWGVHPGISSVATFLHFSLLSAREGRMTNFTTKEYLGDSIHNQFALTALQLL